MYRCFVTLCAVWKNKESNRGVTVITVLPTVVWLLLCLLAARSRCGYLSVYNYTDFFTTCIVDTDVSLTPVNKFTDVLFKNSHIIIYKMHSNSFSKQFFFSGRLPALACSSVRRMSFGPQHGSCLPESSVNQFGFLAGPDAWIWP